MVGPGDEVVVQLKKRSGLPGKLIQLRVADADKGWIEVEAMALRPRNDHYEPVRVKLQHDDPKVYVVWPVYQ